MPADENINYIAINSETIRLDEIIEPNLKYDVLLDHRICGYITL